MGDENKTEDKETVPKADLDALRSKLEKQAADARKRAEQAEGRARELEGKVVNDDFNIKLVDKDGDNTLDDETKGKIETALKKGQEAQQNLVTAVNYAMESKAEALSWEISVEVESIDDRQDILEKLRAAQTPKEMEILAKEIKLEYKEANIGKKKDGSSDKQEDAPSRKFNERGGSGGTNPKAELQKKIDAAKTQEELDALYEDATVLTR